MKRSGPLIPANRTGKFNPKKHREPREGEAYEICTECGEAIPVDELAEHTDYDWEEARHGFHGFVNRPTKFLVGEAGRERVDITPVKRKSKANVFDFDFSGGIKRGDFF